MVHVRTAVGTLDKAMVVLDAAAGSPSGLDELVAVTGLPRATTHRLARSLEDHGLLRRRADGRFTAGWKLLSLGRAAADASPLVALAEPVLARLREETEESVQLWVEDGGDRVCAAALESPHGLRTIVPLGARVDGERGSAAHALRGEVPSVEQGGAGFVASVEEREIGVASVSAPVVGPDGEVVAAVSVSGPVERTSRRPGDRYGARVLEAATELGRALAS